MGRKNHVSDTVAWPSLLEPAFLLHLSSINTISVLILLIALIPRLPLFYSYAVLVTHISAPCGTMH